MSSGLMGMDMCVGCCQMDIKERLSAEQVANHPFILSCRKRKRPAAAKTAAEVAVEAQKSEIEKGGQGKQRKMRKGKKGAEEEEEEGAEKGAEEGERGEEKGAEEAEEEEAEGGRETEWLKDAQEVEEGKEEEAQEGEKTELQDIEKGEEEDAEKVEDEEVEPEKMKKQPSRTQAQQRKPNTKKPKTRTPKSEETAKAGGPSAPTSLPGLTDSGGHIILMIPPHVDYIDDPEVWQRDPRLQTNEFAFQRDWRQCGCNGTCGRRSCPGRRRGYNHLVQKVNAMGARVGCPNPALSRMQVKPRCASCVCKTSACEQHCNITGFCFKFCCQHRAKMKRVMEVMERPVMERPVTIMKRPAAETKRPAARMKRPAAEMEQLAVVLRRPAADA